MRTTAERRGRPDRSRAGNFRSSGGGSAACCPEDTNPRRGHPDRSNVGVARQLDLRRETRNRLREQHGHDFDRIEVPRDNTAARSVSPRPGDFRISTSFGSIDSIELYDYTNSRWVNLKSAGVEHQGAVNIGIFDTGGKFTATDVEGALAESATAIAVLPASLEVMLLDGSQPMTGDLDLGGNAIIDVGSIDIDFTATENDSHAVEVDVDTAGFADVRALDIQYDTDALAAGDDEAIFLVSIDETDSAGGEVSGLEVLATDEGSAAIFGLQVGVGVAPVRQDSGTFGDMDSALVNAADELTDLINPAATTAIFVADDDTVTIGDAAMFGEMEIVLSTGASGAGIAPTFEYSTGVGAWSSFSPTDGTSAFRLTGAILWDETDLSGWVVGTGTEFLIRITRTRTNLTTKPVCDLIQIVEPTIYSWGVSGDLDVSRVTVQANPAAGADNTKSIALTNDTLATAGAQKWSPLARKQGSGWKENATAAAVEVDWREYLVPVQGAAAPSMYHVWESGVSGGYDECMRLTADGTSSTFKVTTIAIDTGGHFGNAIVGVWHAGTGFAVFAHATVAQTTGSYHSIAQSEGTNYINAASGKILHLRNNNVTIAQVDANGMGFGGATTASAALKITSTTQAFGMPSMTTTQRDAIGTPQDGDTVWNSTTGTRDVYDAFIASWVASV